MVSTRVGRLVQTSRFRRAGLLLVLAVLLALGPVIAPALVARAATFSYADRFGGSSVDTGLAVAVDGAGNTYLTGGFEGTADFDPGTGTFSLTEAGNKDIFAVKLSPSGGLIWARALGGTGFDEGRSVTVDGAGNVYLAGRFRGTADFDPGPGITNLTSAGGTGSFAVKLDANGNLVWARAFGGTETGNASGIAVDGSGNVYLTGFFEGTEDFDPGPGTLPLTTSGSRDVYAVKLDSNGNLVWARAFGGPVIDNGDGVAVDGAGNVYLTGGFAQTADFDPGPGITNLISAGSFDTFAVKLDAAGVLVWARAFGGTGFDEGFEVVVDGAGNIYLTGLFEGTADFDPGPGTVTRTSAGDRDVFALKLSASDGGLVWAGALGGTGRDVGEGVAIDGAGNVYLTGEFESTADFDPGSGVTNLTSVGGIDVFAVKLDANGGLVWARAVGSTLDDVGRGVAIDGTANVYLSGSFNGTADFDPGPGTVLVTSAGSLDAFALKLVQAPPVNGVPGTQETAEDTPLEFSPDQGNSLSVTDADNGSSPLRVTLTVTNGTLSLGGTSGLSFIQGDGTADPAMTFTGTLAAISDALKQVTFTPTANFSGRASLQIISRDHLGPTGGQSDTDTVVIGVTAVNDRPAAAPDAHTVAAQSVLTVAAPGVLANDADVELATLQAVLVTGPANGTLTLNPNGSFTYTPSAGFSGADGFTYRASDGTATSSPVNVAITVTLPGCVPRPRVETALAPSNGALRVTVRATPLNAPGTNVLRELRFGIFQNARVTLNGQPITSGQTFSVPANAAAVDFVVERGTPGQPTTVPFTVVDGCGPWNTFVGGGTAAGF